MTCSIARTTATEIESVAALPVIYRRMAIGCVYVVENDTEQAAFLRGIQRNMRNITAVILALVFAGVRRERAVLLPADGPYPRRDPCAREGDYNYKLEATEKDELGILAQEFNALTERIQTTETMRRQFVSDASHELKTPLAAITLMTDSVLQNEMDKGHTILEFVGDIGTEANRLSRMTEKLLQLSRLENVTETKLEVVDLAATVEKVFASSGRWPTSGTSS